MQAAVAACPEDADLVDRLASLLAGSPTESKAVNERIALYERAADRAVDVPRRVAWLERIALLQEEVLGTPIVAARTWARVLELEPNRRTAVRGLTRASTRANDPEGRSRGLLQEASATTDARESDNLRLRAAEALDDDRALRIVLDVLKRHPEHEGARSMAMRLHERAGRWAELELDLGARIEFEKGPRERVRLLLLRADVQRLRLGSLDAALASLRRARVIDGSVGDAIVLLVQSKGDARALRQTLMELSREGTTQQRARWLAHAGEIDELVLGDDRAAAASYQKALEQAPNDPWLLRRRDGVLARAEKRGPSAGESGSLSALRVAEREARAKGAMPQLANTLEQQLASLSAPGPKLGALWAEAWLVEWRLPESPELDVYERILSLAPTDYAAHGALLRRAMIAGDRAAATRALDGLLAQAPDDTTRLAIRVSLGQILEPSEKALRHYREALRIDPRSPTAALGLMRLGELHKDEESIISAACARADLETNGKACATLLVRAAGLLLATADRRLGTEPERKARAADLFERALVADPSSAPAAGTLTTLLEISDPARLIAALRGALERADHRDAVVWLGSELARVAGAREADRPIAISALERVRGVAPDHVPTLLALADAYVAQSAFRHAATTLEAAAEVAKDVVSKKRALFALADIHQRIFQQPAQVETVLRRLCDTDPKDAKALKGLLECLRTRAKDGATGTDGDVRVEIAERLAQLSEAEATPEARSAAYAELAALRAALGDRSAAERALAFAAAESATEGTLAKLAGFCATPPLGPADHARVLTIAADRAAAIGRPSSPLLVALAELEIELGEVSSGVTHARAALGLDPSSHDARATQARGLARVGAHREAVAMALPLFEEDARPLLSLAKPDALLDMLEGSLNTARREQEALVVREVRAVGGAVNDGVVVGLRARRLPDLDDAGTSVLGRDTLLVRVVPREARHLLLDVAIAIAGAEGRCFPDELDALGARSPVPSHHPLALAFARAARELGVEDAELFASDAVVYPRAFHLAAPVVLVPPGLAAQPEPVQLASVARALTRIALGMPWIDRLSASDARGLLTAGARVVAPSYADEDARLVELANSFAKPLAKGIARKHKKALTSLESALADAPAPKQAEVDVVLRGVLQTELRVAFLLTGDLLATLDDLRAADGDYARAAATRGSSALVATLKHPLAGDTIRFALTETATALRRQLGSIWTPQSLGPA
jgi:tetratricopeptide (TPR) repeat protein